MRPPLGMSRPLQVPFHPMDIENTSALERILAKLAELRQLDPNYTLFGSNGHHYALGTPLTDSEVEDYEKALGVALPSEYRDFLMKVGHGGAGPFYGLFQLDGKDMENPTNLDEISKPFHWTEATNPMEWQNSTSEDGVLIESGDEGDSYLEWWIIPGVLYICNYGCALRYFMVVSGPQAGEVWIDRQADEQGIVPERGENGSRLHFLQWYERWLDDGISKFKGLA